MLPFGQQQSAFGAAQAQPTSAFGSSPFGQKPAAVGGAFGTVAPSGLRNPFAPAATTAFGAPTATGSLFGQQQQSQPQQNPFAKPATSSVQPFGATPSTLAPQQTSVFGGAAPSAFGQPQVQQVGTLGVKYQPIEKERDGNGHNLLTMTAITTMKEFRDKSLEMLRWEDYQRLKASGHNGAPITQSPTNPFSNLPGVVGAPTVGGFGASTGAFGSPQAAANPFGVPSAVSATTTTTSPFALQQQPTQTSPFGATQPATANPFGAAQQQPCAGATGFGAFGAAGAAKSFGAFGQQQQTTAFGSPAAAKPFGAAGGGFGTTAQPTTAFGTAATQQKPGGFGFPTAATDAKPFGAFGAQPTTVATPGLSGFPTAATAAGQKPGGAFGAFGTPAIGGGSLGAVAKPFGAFGGGATTTGAFPSLTAGVQKPGGAFGFPTAATTATPSTGAGLGGFGTAAPSIFPSAATPFSLGGAAVANPLGAASTFPPLGGSMGTAATAGLPQASGIFGGLSPVVGGGAGGAGVATGFGFGGGLAGSAGGMGVGGLANSNVQYADAIVPTFDMPSPHGMVSSSTTTTGSTSTLTEAAAKEKIAKEKAAAAAAASKQSQVRNAIDRRRRTLFGDASSGSTGGGGGGGGGTSSTPSSTTTTALARYLSQSPSSSIGGPATPISSASSASTSDSLSNRIQLATPSQEVSSLLRRLHSSPSVHALLSRSGNGNGSSGRGTAGGAGAGAGASPLVVGTGLSPMIAPPRISQSSSSTTTTQAPSTVPTASPVRSLNVTPRSRIVRTTATPLTKTKTTTATLSAHSSTLKNVENRRKEKRSESLSPSPAPAPSPVVLRNDVEKSEKKPRKVSSSRESEKEREKEREKKEDKEEMDHDGDSNAPSPATHPQHAPASLPKKPFFSSLEYSSKPSLSSLSDFTSVPPPFMIYREDVGSVEFLEKIDLSHPSSLEKGLDINSIVTINKQEITVYPDDSIRPDVHSGLNVPARITFYHCYPLTKEMRRSSNPRDIATYSALLQKCTEDLNAEWVDYDPGEGVWSFKVKHFSKYSLSDVWSQNVEKFQAQLRAQQQQQQLLRINVKNATPSNPDFLTASSSINRSYNNDDKTTAAEKIEEEEEENTETETETENPLLCHESLTPISSFRTCFFYPPQGGGGCALMVPHSDGTISFQKVNVGDFGLQHDLLGSSSSSSKSIDCENMEGDDENMEDDDEEENDEDNNANEISKLITPIVDIIVSQIVVGADDSTNPHHHSKKIDWKTLSSKSKLFEHLFMCLKLIDAFGSVQYVGKEGMKLARIMLSEEHVLSDSDLNTCVENRLDILLHSSPFSTLLQNSPSSSPIRLLLSSSPHSPNASPDVVSHLHTYILNMTGPRHSLLWTAPATRSSQHYVESARKKNLSGPYLENRNSVSDILMGLLSGEGVPEVISHIVNQSNGNESLHWLDCVAAFLYWGTRSNDSSSSLPSADTDYSISASRALKLYLDAVDNGNALPPYPPFHFEEGNAKSSFLAGLKSEQPILPLGLWDTRFHLLSLFLGDETSRKPIESILLVENSSFNSQCPLSFSSLVSFVLWNVFRSSSRVSSKYEKVGNIIVSQFAEELFMSTGDMALVFNSLSVIRNDEIRRYFVDTLFQRRLFSEENCVKCNIYPTELAMLRSYYRSIYHSSIFHGFSALNILISLTSKFGSIPEYARISKDALTLALSLFLNETAPLLLAWKKFSDLLALAMIVKAIVVADPNFDKGSGPHVKFLHENAKRIETLMEYCTIQIDDGTNSGSAS